MSYSGSAYYTGYRQRLQARFIEDGADVLDDLLEYLGEKFGTKLKVARKNKDYAEICLKSDMASDSRQKHKLESIMQYLAQQHGADRRTADMSGPYQKGKLQPYFEIDLDLML